MALGSSAPEILLAIIEVFGNKFESGELGPGTIVGSAAFNLFVIIGICVYVIPEGIPTSFIFDFMLLLFANYVARHADIFLLNSFFPLVENAPQWGASETMKIEIDAQRTGPFSILPLTHYNRPSRCSFAHSLSSSRFKSN